MNREEIEKKIDKLEEKKWFMELGDEVTSKEYISICEELRELNKQLKGMEND